MFSQMILVARVVPRFVYPLARAVMLFSALLIICLSGQTQETVGKNNGSATTVEFLFSVTAKKGGPLPQVTTADLSVFDDGSKQSLTSLRRAEELPLALGILLDSSSQKRVSGALFPVAEEEKIISEFLKGLIRAEDKSWWVRFAESSPNVSSISSLSDRAGMQQLVSFGRGPQAGAELLWAFDTYRGELAGAQEARRALIIVANGGTFLNGGTSLGRDMYKRIEEIALRDKIIVYVVDAFQGFCCVGGPRGPSEDSLPRTNLPAQIADLASSIRQSLRQLATDSGGIYLQAFSENEMSKALSRLQGQFSGQYIVTYSPSGLQRSGQFHAVQIRTVDRSIAIHVPKGYYASSH
jgi:VWFA-related protein